MSGAQQVDSIAEPSDRTNGKGQHHVHLSALRICGWIHRHTSADSGTVSYGNVQDGTVDIRQNLFIDDYQ
jgi:hypothetical protein